MKTKVKGLSAAEKAAKLAAIRELTRNSSQQRPLGYTAARPNVGKMSSAGMRQNSSFRKPGV